MDIRRKNFEKIQKDLYGDPTASLREDYDPFIEDLTVPKSKREGFVGGLRVETPTPKPVQKQIQTSMQRPSQEKNIEIKKNIKNKAKTSNKKFIRNIKNALKIGALAATLAVVGVMSHNIYQEQMNKTYSHDIQFQIKQDVVEELKGELSVDDLDFDGENFNVSAQSHRPELYKVLYNTDLDELLNDYLLEPTDDKKESLQGREQELAEFNMNLILASLADSQGKNIDDVSIKAIFNHYNEENGKAIMNGRAPYTGHTLYVESLSGFKHDGKNDLTQISNELFDLISDARFQVMAPNSSYFEYDENSKLDRAIETYKEIKKRIKDKNFSISNGKMHTENVGHNDFIITQEDDEKDL